MKGFVQTLEAGIAAVLILSLLIYAVKPIVEKTDLSNFGYNCLKGLDNDGKLRADALNDTDSLKTNIRACLPSITDFEVRVCDSSNCPPTNIPNKDVYLTSYIIAGDDKFQLRLINLWIWLA